MLGTVFEAECEGIKENKESKGTQGKGRRVPGTGHNSKEEGGKGLVGTN